MRIILTADGMNHPIDEFDCSPEAENLVRQGKVILHKERRMFFRHSHTVKGGKTVVYKEVELREIGSVWNRG